MKKEDRMRLAQKNKDEGNDPCWMKQVQGAEWQFWRRKETLREPGSDQRELKGRSCMKRKCFCSVMYRPGRLLDGMIGPRSLAEIARLSAPVTTSVALVPSSFLLLLVRHLLLLAWHLFLVASCYC